MMTTNLSYSAIYIKKRCAWAHAVLTGYCLCKTGTTAGLQTPYEQTKKCIAN